MLIIKPHLSEEKYQEVISGFEKWITSTGGEITLLKPWGTRELATEFDKNTHGYYVQCQFKAENATLEELNSRLRVNESIFRFLLVTMDSIRPKNPRVEKVKKPKAEAVATATSDKAPVSKA